MHGEDSPKKEKTKNKKQVCAFSLQIGPVQHEEGYGFERVTDETSPARTPASKTRMKIGTEHREVHIYARSEKNSD